jgi:flagellar basal body-associated protein FliL
MKPSTSGILGIFYRILLILGLALVLFLAGGTIYGLIFRNSHPVYTIPVPSVPASAVSQGQSIPVRDGVFTGIGRLRVVTADKPPVTVIISIAFPYTPEDRPFTEELASKIPDFRRVISEYFGAHTAEDLQEIDEGTIKAELLRRYNRLLHLGTIEILYFNDFMLIE